MEQSRTTNTNDMFADLETGIRVQIDQELFDMYLDILPPVYMCQTKKVGEEMIKVDYGFAEGIMKIIAFWQSKDAETGETKYFCQQTEEWARGY